MGYQSMQTKEFSRQILDFKARLLLRKTQFPNMIHKWNPEVSQYCLACLDKGDQQSADFKHILFECPVRMCIIEHIRANLTKQVEVRPVDILFGSNRCFYQTHKSGAQRQLLLKHDKCAVHDKATTAQGKALDLIWTHYLQIIMLTLYKDQTPNPDIVMIEIVIEIQAQIRAKPNCPVSHYLKILLEGINIPNQ